MIENSNSVVEKDGDRLITIVFLAFLHGREGRLV